ncbi:ATP-binding protein [Tahibacter sp.]|uniref:ATP-binding protein n=1 Tax=Tahibacter sp. TaxID=2056211 RepID=UPI0039C9AAE4
MQNSSIAWKPAQGVQPAARRALGIAVAGAHDLLLCGAPGRQQTVARQCGNLICKSDQVDGENALRRRPVAADC